MMSLVVSGVHPVHEGHDPSSEKRDQPVRPGTGTRPERETGLDQG